MSFFRKKQPEKPVGERLSFVTNRPAREFGQAESFAIMLANQRRSGTVEIADVLAGVYIAHFEKLAKYWADPEALEAIVEDHCHINSERWLYWFQNCQQMFRASKSWHFGRFLLFGNVKGSFVGKFFKRSPDLEAVLRVAEQLTPFRWLHPVIGKELPVITSECFVLSVARSADLDISRHLRESGLDVQRLEEAVRSPKKQPRF